MKTLQMFLFPAFSLTGPLIFATTSSGLLVAIGLQCVTRRPLPRLWERCRKALGYGGTLGVAVCLFILMAFDDTGRPKLSPGELANTALLGFATAGLVAAGAQYLLALLSDRWMGPPDRLGKDSQPRHLRSAPVTARFSAHPAPPISVRRVPRR